VTVRRRLEPDGFPAFPDEPDLAATAAAQGDEVRGQCGDGCRGAGAVRALSDVAPGLGIVDHTTHRPWDNATSSAFLQIRAFLAFATDRSRLLVRPEPQEHGMPQMPVGRPLHEPNLRDESRSNPLHFLHLLERDAAAPPV
jgi:hypothetical protein